MNIEIEQLTNLVEKADQIFLNPDAEKVLIKLLEIQKQVEDAITQAQKKLEETALKINPNFSSIQSDKIKVYYRAYGQKYYVDESNIKLTPKELYKVETKTVFKVDAKAVEDWVKNNKGMPTGIFENTKRVKSLKFSLK